MSREKRSFAQEVCVKSAGKAMQKTGMLWPGCRVGVAVSGGVDSFVLLKTLKIRQGIVPFRFELMAVHLNPGFDPHSHAALLPWLAGLDQKRFTVLRLDFANWTGDVPIPVFIVKQ